jgi:hypothetical protein
VRCESCRAEYLLAFSCKTRYFCPSYNAKRLASWTLWLGVELLAPVPHRQMVFVLPKRLRPYFQWRRKLLGDLARIAACTAKDFVRPPAHSAEELTEAFRRYVVRLFVERELFEPEVADNMLDWLHSGFSVHDGVWLDQDDTAAHERLARYCARCPVSLERLAYDAEIGTVTYTSDQPDSPPAGRHTFEAPAFITRLVAHIPDKGQVLQRYYGYYANRTRGERRKAEEAARGGGGEGGRGVVRAVAWGGARV